MNFLFIIVLALSLSMDAFSLSLAYGTLSLSKKNSIILSSIVGIYHFIMPLIGLLIGNILLRFIKINPDIIVFVVLSFIGIQMLLESFKKEEIIEKMNIIEMLIFGFAVSIDSFSVGIGLKAFKINPLICTLLFSIISFLFTYLGLILGKQINKLIGKVSTILGGITLIILGIIYLF